jgi:Na+-driven multidrug efflux pump
MSVSVLLDIFFVSTVPISLQLGTRGLAYSSIASQGSVLIFTLVVCWRMLGIRRQDLVKNINILLKKLSDMRIRFKLGLNIL